MLDITGKDIANLNDTDLRALVARLCEAELRRNNLPISSLTAGGNQDAADGGVDVRVELNAGSKTTDFILRPNTGFQVKVSDMPRSEILNEMQPNGSVRTAIQDLARNSGAYIIVSSTGSTTDSALRSRRDAMRKAVDGMPHAAQLALDFYDRERIAFWVRLYPGVVLWVRQQLRKPLRGWQPFGNWAAPMEAPETEYLWDEKCRLHDDRSPSKGGLIIEEGIGRIREVLTRQNGTARLIGLSGVGKTRLVQALFDARIGENALDQSEVIYTDIADEPRPSPRDLIRDLVQDNQRAIVIIDNCPPTTHRALALTCATSGSSVSLLTVEHDVSDDDPEGTEVFRLEAASDGVIEQLIARREPHISRLDRQRIANFSGGNSKIALALARTVGRDERVSTLSDAELFERLFHQRHHQDASLLRAAEACALVYSFDGETRDGDDAELPILAELAGQTVDELYRHIRELKDRDLLQQRSKWRAILPHALANRLAHHALDRLMPDRITNIMLNRAPERLKKSFSRRLGYLHDCDTARSLAEAWLSDSGFLADLSALGPVELAMFLNVAPAAPLATLDALERALKGDATDGITDSENPERRKMASLLRSLAYEATSFPRAALLLARVVMAEPADHNHNSTRQLFTELFHLYLSGTQATAQQRLHVIEALLTAGDGPSQTCGFIALAAMLKAGHFSSSHRFDFGAHSRDFGWEPKTIDDASAWYHAAIHFALAKITSNSPLASRLSTTLAANFRVLWAGAHVYDDLEAAVATITAQGFWAEGWISVKTTLGYDAASMREDILRRLRAIEATLRPNQLVDKARAYAFSNAWGTFDVADGEEGGPLEEAGARSRRAEEQTQAIGHAVASDSAVLTTLLPDLSRGESHGRRWFFGVGLAEGASDIEAIWKCLADAIASAPENERNIQVLRGFLSRAICLAPETATTFLDDSVYDSVLGPWFPNLQCSVGIDKRGVDRLLAAIQHGVAPVWRYRQLVYGGATDPIPADDLRRLLTSISMLPEGFEVAVEILYMKLDSMRDNEIPIDRDLVECGRDFLLQCPFHNSQQQLDYKLARIAGVCLAGVDAAECAEVICTRLAEKFSASGNTYINLLKTLFRMHPLTALTTFFAGEQRTDIHWVMRNLSDREHPLDEVSLEVLITWANADALQRFSLLVSVIPLFVKVDGKGNEVLSPKTIGLLNAAPDPQVILSCDEDHFRPSCWSGSLADIFEGRRLAIKTLASHPHLTVVAWAEKWDRKLAELAEEERAQDRSVDEHFE